MRKWVWYACLIAVLAIADLVGSAYYVYKNPDSLLGRCAVVSFELGVRYNPFLYGVQTVSDNVATLVGHGAATAAPAASESFERPEEPAAVEEAEVVEPAAQEGALAQWVRGHIILEDNGNAEEPVVEQSWFSRAFENTQEPPLAGCTMDPACAADAKCEHVHGWFMKAVEDCVAAAKAMSDVTFVRCWFGYIWGPSVLEDKGGVETSEPMDGTMPDSSPEDPYQSYHHNDCPYTGACPYSGKMPSVEPEDRPVQTEPIRLPKIKMKPPKRDDDESERPIYRPDIDTMEFRDSDRTWDDYGDPMQL
jgi:hypothetical protein